MRLALLLALPLLLSACAGEGDPDTTPAGTAAEADSMADLGGMDAEPDARATIQPLGDSGVSGTVTFMPAEGGVQVTYALGGLAQGTHGFHVHENGACGPGEDGAPGGAAGGHYAPMGSPHGAPSAPVGRRHVGDFGNIEAGTDGRAAGTFVDSLIGLDGPTNIVGKAIVVHAGADDLTSQPSGDSGDRVGCGVVQEIGTTGRAGGLPAGHPPIDTLVPGQPPVE